MRKSFKLEILTPSKNFFSGLVDELIITTPNGKEGFLANHSWTCKLLDAGKLMVREEGSGPDDWRVASAASGFIDVKDSVVIYTDAIEWDSIADGRASRPIYSK